MVDTTFEDDSPSYVAAAEARVWATARRADTVEVSLWLVVLVAVTLDVYTTYLGLSAGLAEGNPIMRWAIEGYGFGALALAKVFVLGCAGLVREARPGDGVVIALGVALPSVLTVVANVVTLTTA